MTKDAFVIVRVTRADKAALVRAAGGDKRLSAYMRGLIRAVTVTEQKQKATA